MPKRKKTPEAPAEKLSAREIRSYLRREVRTIRKSYTDLVGPKKGKVSNERCDTCGSIFDDRKEGHYDEASGRHYCGATCEANA